MTTRQRLASLLLVACVYAAGAIRGLPIGFDQDDIMNLHQAWLPPLPDLLWRVAVPFTVFNRPAGALYYRLCFALFGLHAPGFRAVTWALMLANVGMVFALARRLSSSAEAGVLAALLFAFHGRLLSIYFSNGTVYDVLCAFFSLAALLVFTDERRDPRFAWLVIPLFILALNAKEMAAVLPAVFLVYELTASRSPRRWLILATGLIAIGALWAKTRAGGAFYQEPGYAMTFTPKQFFQNARRLESDLFYLSDRWLRARDVVLIWIALLGLAFRTRNKALLFSAAFVLISPLPILFVPPRGFFVMYLPLAGWAIWLGTALQLLRARLLGPETGRLALACAVALAVLAGTRDPALRNRPADPYWGIIASTIQDFRKLAEPLPPSPRLLLLHDRWEPVAWGPLMIARLSYRDRGLWVDRPGMPAAVNDYDRVLDFDGNQLVVLKRSGNRPSVEKPQD